jgi:hypothetical protein
VAADIALMGMTLKPIVNNTMFFGMVFEDFNESLPD